MTFLQNRPNMVIILLFITENLSPFPHTLLVPLRPQQTQILNGYLDQERYLNCAQRMS